MISIRSWFPVLALLGGLGVAAAGLAGAKPTGCAAKAGATKCTQGQKDECCPGCCETQDECCPDCCKSKCTTAQCSDKKCSDKKCSDKKCSDACCETSGSCCSQSKDCCSKCAQAHKKCDCTCDGCCKTSKGCCAESAKDDKKCGCTCGEGKCCKGCCADKVVSCTGCCKETHGKCCAKCGKHQKEILEALKDVREMLEEMMSGPVPPMVLMPPARPDGSCALPPPVAYGPVPPMMPAWRPMMPPPAPIAMPGADDRAGPKPPPCCPAPVALVPAVCPSPAAAPTPPPALTWAVRVVEKEGKSRLEVQAGGATCLTCKQAELSGPGGEAVKVQASDHQVQVCGPCLHGVADCVTRTGTNDCLILDGHVSLTYCKDGQSADLTGGHVVIGLSDGKVEISPCAAGAAPGDGIFPVSCPVPAPR